MKSLVVLSGAGMSADSGLSTFRNAGGLWEGYDIEEVASIYGWQRNPKKVLEFYNIRRRQASRAEPNPGHLALVDLEKAFDVTIITQNVDDLHERAGSSNVVHLHGELKKARSSRSPDQVVEIGDQPIHEGDLATDGSQLRPHVVWFGEEVPMIGKAAEIISSSDLLVVIGTSLSVYPAAGLVDLVPTESDRYLVDPAEPSRNIGEQWEHIKKNSAEGTPQLVQKLLKQRHE